MKLEQPRSTIPRRAAIRRLLSAASTLALAGIACQPRQETPSPSSRAVETQAPRPAPARTRPAEWNVVIAEQTGGGDPLTEYGTNAASFYLVGHVLEPLAHIALLPDGSAWGVVNDLAERWRFADPKTFVAEIRQGIKFHNGEDLTAEHVKFSYDSIMQGDKPTRRATSLKPLGQAEVVDKFTIRWRMPAANLSVLRAINNLLVMPLARKEMTSAEFEPKPIGTGPYKAVSWERDGITRLEAWDGYRLGKPVPERLTVRYVAEPSSRVAELLAGTAQIAQRVPVEATPSIDASPKLDVVSLQGSTTLSYVINLFKTSPPFRDRRVRQAMNYAVDREPIVKSIMGGRGGVLPGPLWSGWMGHTDSVKPYPYDPDRARALLKEAGHAEGFSFAWTVTQGAFPKDIEIAEAVANQLAKVGIKANLRTTERARLLAERNEGDFDVTELNGQFAWDPATLFTFTVDAPFPDAKLTPKLGATPPELAEVRRLLKEAQAAADYQQMANVYAQVNRLVHDEAFWVFVHTVDEIWGVQKDTEWRPYPANPPDLSWYDYWTMIGKKAPVDTSVPLIVK